MPDHRHVRVNGVELHIVEQGEGPLVLLLHGFPETWYSWRHQIPVLAAAGYRVVALDQRGYGESDRPDDVADYTIFHLVGDVVALVRELGEEQAVVVGHDWGAVVAWHTALLRPELVRGVVGVSVPPLPRPPVAPLTITKQKFGANFYQNYFQEPGVAEASLGKDVRVTLRKTFAAVPNPSPDPAGDGFLGLFADPESLPSWLTEQDLETYVEQFSRSGFTGALNWYRNIDRNWELTAAWQDAPITPPALYISGLNDVVRAFYTFGDAARAIVPNLRGVVDVPDCGHWTQQEKPEVVTDAVLDFLRHL